MNQGRFIQLHDITTNTFELVNRLFDELVPPSGPAKSLVGEIVRAMSRIGYRFLNDGDRYYEGSGLETVAPAMQYIIDFIEDHGDAKDIDKARKLIRYFNEVGDESKQAYEDNIRQIFDIVFSILSYDRNEELLDMPNKGNYMETSARWFELNQPLYDVEFQLVDQDIIDLLDKGVIDSDQLVDYVHDAIEAEFGRRDWDIDVLFNDYDHWFTVTNLHRDERDAVEQWGRSADFWESLKDEYRDSMTESVERRIMREYKERCNRCKADYIRFNLDGSQLREDLTEDDLDDDAATRCCFKYNCGRSQLIQMLKDAD